VARPRRFVTSVRQVLRALPIGLLVALAGGAPAAAAPPGAPAKLRVARAADLRAHVSAPYEEWLIRASDPRSGRRVSFTALRRTSDPPDVRGLFIAPGEEPLDLGFDWRNPDADGATTWRGDEGRVLALRRHGSGWTLSAETKTFTGTIRIAHPRPGGAASRWTFSPAPGQGSGDLSWSEPIATGSADGSIAISTFDGRTAQFDMHGWRISVEHWWGRFSRDWQSYYRFQTYVLHEPHGAAWSLVGVNRLDRGVGIGASEAQWRGVLVRTGRRRTSLCRPSIQRSRKQPAIRARCGGRSVTIRQVPGSGYDISTYQYGAGEFGVRGGRNGFGAGRSISPLSG
jgi:hypothetical protein